MTFNGKISNLWTANMYVAEEQKKHTKC